MRRFAVIGSESAVGSAVLNHLQPVVSASGVSLSAAAHVPDICRQATDIVLCGDASASSWDDDFGTFEQDRALVPKYCRIARQTNARFIYVSSDAVFDGPWIFHDDHSTPSKLDADGHLLRSLENHVIESADNLVVRTNALTDANDGFLGRLRDAMVQPGSVPVRSDVYSTPLAAERMAAMLAVILSSDASGTLHLAGAERLSPWNFALGLALAQSLDRSVLTPVAETSPRERSLRCSRALSEFHLRMPTLSQTLSDLTDGDEIGSRQAA